VLLLFLGTLWFGYLQMSKVNSAEEEARRQIELRLNEKMKLTFLQHYVEEISDVIGEKGPWSPTYRFRVVGEGGSAQTTSLASAARLAEGS